MAQEVAEGKVDGEGTAAEVPAIVLELVPEVPPTWWEHEELTVDGAEGSTTTADRTRRRSTGWPRRWRGRAAGGTNGM
jgi:hypothetical protein